MTNKIIVQDTLINVMAVDDKDYISLTDMMEAKNGDFFISDWLRNRNTVEFLESWEQIHNPDFNYGKFAIIKSQARLNSYKISVKEWVTKTNAIGLRATAIIPAIQDEVYNESTKGRLDRLEERKKEL